jgi:hypothetical protein
MRSMGHLEESLEGLNLFQQCGIVCALCVSTHVISHTYSLVRCSIGTQLGN